MVPARIRVDAAFKLLLIKREIRSEYVGNIQILRVHLQAAGLGCDVVNMDVSTVPSLFGERRPTRQGNRYHSIRDGTCLDCAFSNPVLVTLDYLVAKRQG